MNNNQIIYNTVINQLQLTPEQADQLITAFGEIPYHTYNEWATRGMQVKKGEHAAITCYLWKYRPGKKGDAVEAPKDVNEVDGDESPRADFVKVKSYLFGANQVQRALTDEEKEAERRERFERQKAECFARLAAKRAAAHADAGALPF